MFEYVNKGGDFNIVAPPEHPKHEVISNEPGRTHSKFTYSNGWILESIVQPHEIKFISNRELIKKDDGKYHLKP